MAKKKEGSVKATKNRKAALHISASLGKAQYGEGDESAVTFKAAGEGDGSYKLIIMMKCFPDGQGGWVCN